MNDDHTDAVVLYAQAFGGVDDVTTARMQKIDAEGMDLLVESNGAETPLRIAFDHTLQDAEDAHHTLIVMVKQALQMISPAHH
jgi:putative heme iron utilization protein